MIPFWDEFCYVERFPGAARPVGETTRRQREYFLLYASCKDAEVAAQRAEEARRARSG